MKIIKKGKLKPVKKTKHCHKCKTLFSFTNADIESDRDGSYVKCPVCKTFIAVTPKPPNLPQLPESAGGNFKQ